MTEPTTPLPSLVSAGSEIDTLRGFLGYYRAVVRRKAEGLNAAELALPLAPTSMTLGGMVKHLALVEDDWLAVVVLGGEPSPPWDTVDWDADRDWDWHSAADDDAEDLLALYDAAVARSDEVLDGLLAEHGAAALDLPTVREPRFGPANLRWVLVHLIEEYARHAGHADLLREAIDGVTGD